MANSDAPNGFRPTKSADGEPRNNVYSRYTIASGYGTSIFSGDPVKSTGTGASNGAVGIQVAAAGDTVRGVFAGVNYIDAQGRPIFSKYWPASTVATQIEALVYDDPEMIFEVQASTSVAATDLSNKADFVNDGSGSTVYGTSTYELDSSSIGGGGKDGLLIMGLVSTPDNAFGTNAKLYVRFNQHELLNNVLVAV